ncbi:hypothetical protein [Acanthopleuribacter pedis]|uniref:Uncharacterized protein n=1 Tax=Acanthopleuribacter pedis TaxID=442870 RepID=A0A8J7U5V8_9BACT|nr:hypothetical protein [Acanthopleuribacter pedis]MBO1320878.1 hypothetical protein [Acanthopleuribacter pedis]
MNLDEGTQRKPIVVVEDHLYHIGEILQMLLSDAPEIAAQLCLVCLDRPGPDTDAAAADWLAQAPDVTVAAAVNPGVIPAADRERLVTLPPACFEDTPTYCRTVAGLLRPGGLLLQDIQLGTLRFLPDERWWESIYLANTIRGMFATLPPHCRFMSNKSGFEATFGADLFEVGFDPREVLAKHRLPELLVPVLQRFRRRTFPLLCRLPGPDGWPQELWLNDDPREPLQPQTFCDLVLWHDRRRQTKLLGTRLKTRSGKNELLLKRDTKEFETWQGLVTAFLDAGPGLPVREVGRRLAPEDAGNAEISNAAARHIHALRARLNDPTLIQTEDHHYRLGTRWTIAEVKPYSG